MAIDSRLSLATTPTNLHAAITGGLQTGETIRNSGVRDEILRQQEQIGAQTVQQNKVVQAQQKGAYMKQLSIGLKKAPVGKRASIVSQQMNLMQEMGFDPSEVMTMDLSDTGLDQTIASNQAMNTAPKQQPTAGMQDFQFYQEIIENPNSTPDQVQAAKIKQGTQANVGRSQIEEVSDGVFQSYNPNTEVFGPVYRVEPDGTQVPLTRKEQNELNNKERSNTVTTVGQAQTAVDVDKAGQLSGIEIEEQRIMAETTARIQRSSTLKADYSTKSRQSASSAVKLSEAMQLSKTSDQGLTGTAKLYLSRLFPSIDVSNESALDSALLGLALDGLQQFSGPTTDFEFGIVQRISGSLLGSAEANQARISSLQRNNWFVQKEAEQFMKWADSGKDPDAFKFNFNEKVTVGKGDKKQDITLQDLQETAVHYGISIDEALLELNR
jgi:hypothetical protein